MTLDMARVYAATPAFFDADLKFERGSLAEHYRWLGDSGVGGLSPNGSLGEYQALDDEERAEAVRVAVEVAGTDMLVVPGVASLTTVGSVHWAEQARDAGADGVMALPPTGYRASQAEVLAHYEALSRVGLPIIVYNNPFDTRVDLVPELIARIAQLDNVVGVKEFSCDVRRVPQILDVSPATTVMCGADDVLLESLLVGATGWISGFVNSYPRTAVHLLEEARAGRIVEVADTYRTVLPAFRWDSGPKFVQAIKLALDLGGRYGGPTRSPRGPLEADEVEVLEPQLRAAEEIERSLA